MGGSFEVKFPLAAIQARIENKKSEIKARKPEILSAIGFQIVALNQKDYRSLSRGGTASDGRKWNALDPKTIARKARRGRKPGVTKRTYVGNVLPSGNVSAIGIDTGLQFAACAFEIRLGSVTVGYFRSYSKYFDEKRKLWPDTLPESWRASLQALIKIWLEGIISGTIGN